MLQNDVLGIIDPCISSVLPSMRAVTVELLTLIIDFNQQIFREYLIKQFRQVPETKNVCSDSELSTLSALSPFIY
jgi:hypothetical protein